MANLHLSESEKTFILHGVADNLRTDGRSRQDYRFVEIETDVVTHASGSAHVRLANTDVLVAIKAELDVPFPDRPDQGKLEFFVDCSATATPEFEGRGGERLSQEISHCLARAYQNQEAFDLSKLSVLPGKQCWVLYVDILVLQCGGNLFDAVSIGVKAAVANVRIPRVTVATIDGGQLELEISDDPYDCERLNAQGVPCLVTLTKIGNYCVVDPTPEEEACSMGNLVVAVTQNGNATASRKTGRGSFHAKTLQAALQMAIEVGVSLNESLMEKVKAEEAMGPSRPRCGFLH